MRYFASGLAGRGELLGFSNVGINVGVTIPTLVDGDLEVLESLAGTGRLVFVDSGAFGEVEFVEVEGGGVERVVKALITDEEWQRRLAVYERLALALGAQVFVVAPDAVGDQRETLERLERYASRVRAIRALGANVIVPHQRGEFSLSEFNAYAEQILGFADFVVGLPSNKAALPTDELVAFLAAELPARLHLLGLGPLSDRWDEVFEAVRRASPDTEVFCDSVPLTAVLGRTNGPNHGPRAYTAAKDASAELAVEVEWAEGVEGTGDYTDNVVEGIDAWLTAKATRRRCVLEVASAAGLELSSREVKEVVEGSLQDWLQAEREDGSAFVDNDWVDQVLNGYWATWYRRSSTAWREARAIGSVFGATTRGAALRGEVNRQVQLSLV